MNLRTFFAAAAAALGVALAPGLAQAQSCASPGLLGPGNVSGIVNTYYAGASPVAPAGAMSIGVGAIDPRGAATPIAAGDLLLIVQVQDASISTSNSSAYGGSGFGQGYTSLGSSGLYEYAIATGPAGGSVPLATPLVNTYRSGSASSSQGQRRYQVIRVPQYSSATVTGTVTAPPWNGSTGGVVAFDVAGSLNWNGQTINVDGRGFRGGGGQCSGTNATGSATANTDYRSAVGGGTLTLGAGGGSVPNGAKGEGIAGTPILVFEPSTPFNNGAGTTVNTGGTDGSSGGYPGGSFGRGAPGNGGGGGTDGNTPTNDENTGGAGGGNYSIGGKGGFGWTPGTPPGVDSGGFGGGAVPGGAARLFFGGGGGAASTNNCTGSPAGGQASSGGAGGGLVFVRAGTTTSSVTVNARGTSANSTITNDASGGGGAGGSVLIFVNNGGGGVGATINVQGGDGGSNTGGGSPHGPGGGGSGGFAITSGSAAFNVAGGVGGTTAGSATSTPDYGSTASSGGFQIVSLNASQIPGVNGTSACFPQLTVTKATTTPYVAAGMPATWTITVSNAPNKGAATGVAVTDVLPANPNITYASPTSVVLAGGATRTAVVDPAAGATSPVWSSFTIPGGGSVALTFQANTNTSVATGVYQNPATVAYLDPTRTAAQTVSPGGSYTAGGTVGGSNYNPASSTNEDVTVLNPPPTIAKSFSPAAVNVGATSVLTTVVSNTTPVALTGVGLTDNYPAGMVNSAAPNGTSSCGGTVSAAPAGPGFVLSGASLAAGATCTITVNVVITATGSYVNTIAAGALTSTQGITNPAPASATLYSNVTVAKSFSPTAVPPNSDATLSLVLNNPNTLALNLANPGLTDTFPVGLVATGGAVGVSGAGCTGFAPATVAAGATSLVLTAGTLPPNASCTVTLAVRSATAGNYSNTSGGVTTTQTGTTGPPSNTSSLGVGLINITKAFSPSTIVQGGTSTITYTLVNPTGVAQTGGAFLDTMVNMAISANQAVGGTCTGTTPATFNAGDTALNFTGINIPAAGCTVSVVVTSNVVGTLPNATNGVTTSVLPQGPGSNNADLFVLARPAIAKAFAPATIQPGGTSTLTFTISNAGPLPLSGMQFTDSYPAGLVNASPLTVGGSCTGLTHTATAGGNTFNVTGGNIPANASCTITVLVQAAAQGPYANTASAVATSQTGAGVTGSNTATLTVAGSPTVTKAFGTSPISQGGTSTITFTVANPNAGFPLDNVRFTDTLVNMSVANATIGGTCAGTTSTPALAAGATSLDLTVPTIAGGASCTVTVTVTSSVSGTHPNTTSGATSTQTPAAGPPSNTASLVVPSPPVLGKNFAPGAIQSGGTSSIVFTLTNNNGTALTNVQFTDPLVNMALGAAPGVTETCGGTVSSTGIGAGSTSFQLTLNTLAAGETCTITVSPVTSSVASPASGHPNTTSTVSSTQTSVNRGAPATGNLIVYAPPTVTKSFAPNNIATSGTSVITFTVTNPNALSLSDIRFTDDLPTNLSNTAAQTFVGGARGTCIAAIPTSKVAGLQDPITFSNINLAAGASCTVMMNVTSATAGVYNNTATNVVSDQTPTPVTGGSDTLAVGRISITKTFGAPTLQVNGTTTLTFSLANPGVGNNIGNIQFTDTFPAGLVAVGGAVTFGGPCTGGAPTTIAANATAFNLTDLDDLDNGETCTATLSVRGTTAGTKNNTVTVTATNPAGFQGATDTATVTVYAAPTIAKAFSPATIAAGGTSTLTFTLANPNAFAPLTGAAFTDTLANMSVAGAQTVGGTCAGITPATLADGATALSFSGISIPSAGSCTVTVEVTSTVPGTHPNTASGVTTTQTPTAGANSGAVNLVVGGVNITKAFAPTTRPVGAPTRLTITLTSTQAVDWTGLAFTDTLPANLVVANPPNAATTCGAGTVGAVAGASVVTLSGGTMPSGASPCTVAVDVVSSVTGAFTNNASNFSGLSSGLSATGANATVTYGNAASLTKAFAPASIAPGATSVLTFTITNGSGAPAASGLAFTDTLPANVVVAATPGVANSCGGSVTAAAGSGAIALAGGSVGAAPATCTISVNVTSAILGNYNNGSGNVTGLAGGLSASGMNAALSVVGTSLAKSHTPATIGRNGVATMTFTITNGAGNPAQSGLGFIENLRANVFIAPVPNITNTCGGTVTALPGAGTATFAGGSIAAGVASCSWSVDVTSSVSGSYLNDSTRVVNAPASMDTSGVNSTLTVIENPTATKAFGAPSIASGGTTSLTLTFTNPNGAALTGLAFTDTFPAAPGAMTLADTTTSNTCGGTLTDAGGGALGAGDAGIRLTGGTLPAGGSCSVTVNVTATVAGTYTNTLAAGTITTTNGGAVSTPTTANLAVLARPAITKAFGAASIPTGGTTTLTVTLANPNAVALTGAAFADTLPVAPGAMTIADNATANTCGGTLQDQAAGAIGAGDTAFQLSGGTIPAGGSCSVTVNVTAGVAGTYANTIAAGGLTTTNGGASTAAANASLVVLAVPTATKAFAPAAIFPGATSVLTITLTNPNATAVTGAAFTDTYPAGLTNTATPAGATTCPGGAVTAPASGTSVALSGGTIPANGSCTVTVNVTSNTVGVFVNTTGPIATADAGTAAAANGTLTVVAGIASTKVFAPVNIAAGGTATLTVTLANPNTTTTVTGIAFNDAYPAAVTNSATPGAATTCAGGTVTAAAGGTSLALSGASLAPGASCTVSVQVTSNTPGTHVNALGDVTAANAPTTGGDSTVLLVNGAPTVAKAFTPTTIGPGGTSQLRLTLANPATNPGSGMTGISVSDPLGTFGLSVAAPATVVFTPAACGTLQSRAAVGAGGFGAVTAGHQELSFAVASLAPGATCQVDVNVTSTTPGAANNTTSAPAATGPVATTGTAASATLTVAQAALTKAFVPAAIDQGGVSTLTFTLANGAGNPAQSGIAFTDTLPANVVVAASPNIASTCPSGPGAIATAAGGNTITVSGASMSPGQASCTISVDVTGNTPGTYNNTNAGNITATQRVTTTGVNATLSVQALPTLTKAFAPAIVGVGQNSVLTFTVTNPAGAPARTGLTFTDSLPAGTIVGTPNGVANTCGGAPTITATPGSGTFTVGGTGVNAAAGPSTCTIAVNVTSNTAGSYVNGASRIVAIGGMLNGVTDQALEVRQATLTKAFTGPLTIGGTTTLVFTLTNGAGNPAQAGLSFTDTLPAGLVVAGVPNIQSSCPAGGALVGGPAFVTTPGGVITVSGAAMDAGVASCEIRVNVAASATPTVGACPIAANTNDAASIGGLARLTNGVTAQCVAVIARPTVAKAYSPNPVAAGGTAVLTITLANSNSVPVTGVAFTDTNPAGVLNTATPSGATTCGGTLTAAPSGTSVALSGGTIPANGSCTVTVNQSAAAAGTYANTIAIGDVTSANAGSNAVAANATLNVFGAPTLAKGFTPATIGPGGTSTLTFTITNPAGNPAPLTGVAFADTLPTTPGAMRVATTPAATTSGCGTPTFAPAANDASITFSGGTVAPGGTCTVSVDVTAANAGTYDNTSGALSATGPVALTGNTANASLTVSQAALTKAFAPAAIDQGGVSTLTFTITNGAGNPAQSGIAFTDTLPANVVVAPTPNIASTCPGGPGAVTAAAGGGTIAVANASMNAAQPSCTISVDVTSAVAGTYDNTSANISGAARLTTTGVASTLTVQAPATLTKAFGASAIGIGQATTLTFTIPNTGANAVNRTGISFTDTLPAGLVIANPPVPTSANCGSPSFTAADGTPAFTASNVSVNAGQSCTITLAVRGTTLGTKTNNAASITAISGVANGVTPQSVEVVQASLGKAFAPATIPAGGTSTLTFTLANAAGNPAQAGIGFTDNLPGNVRVAATPNVQTDCPAGAGAFGPPAFTVTAAAGAASVVVSGASMNAATASCQVRVDVTSAIGGAYTNDAPNLSGLVNVTNAVGPATLTVTSAAPVVAKAFAPATVNANVPSTLTITLTNANSAAATLTAALVDSLPGTVVVAPTPNVSTTCAGAGAVVAAAGGSTVTLPAGRVIPAAAGVVPGSCTVTVDVVSAFGGAFTNTIAAGALQASNGDNAAPASALLTVNAAAPGIAKAFAPAAIAADGTSTITFTIANPNTFALTGAGFGDTLASMRIAGNQAAGGTCAGAAANNFTDGQSGLLAVAGLTIPAAAGATPGSCTVTLVVTSDVPGAHNNQATGVSSTEASTGPASNVAVLAVTAAPATIAKAFAPSTIAYGGTSTVTLTLANTNGAALTGAAFGDTLANMSVAANQPAGGTCAGAAGNVLTAGQVALAFSGLTIPPNASCTVTFTVTSTVPGTHPNATTGVSSNEAATGPASNVAQLTVNPLAPTITKQFVPATIASGGTSTLQVTITNPNAAAITGVGLTDTFPATPGTGLVRAATPNASAGASCGAATVSSTANSLTLANATLAAGASCTFQVDVTAATQGAYVNTIAAGALASSAGTNAAPASATLTVTPLADLAIVKAGPATIGLGAPIAYTITITNAGPDAAPGATFTDAVPAEVSGVGASCSAGGGAACGTIGVAGNVVSATFPALPAGGTLSITVTGTASGLAPITNTATVAPPAGVNDPASGNNSSSATTTVLAPDLVLAKAHVGNFTVGSNGTYTLTASNQPGALATSGTLTVTDTLPAGLGFVSATGTGWTCGFVAPTVTCTSNATLAGGASANPITLVVSVASIAMPAVTNFAAVSGGGEPASLSANNGASDYTIVVAAAFNTFAPDGAQAGMPGSVLFYPHTFTAGSAGSVTFSASSVQSPAVPGWTQAIYHDVDCSATLDAAEGAAPLAGPIVLSAGQSACIVVRDSIPATAPYNAQNVITVTSTFNGASTITRTDVTTVGAAAGAGLTLSKSVRNVTQGGVAGTSGTARPNDVLEYTITFTNTSPASVSAIVVTDATPAFTMFVSAACTLPLPASLSSCNVTSQPVVNGTGSVVWTLPGSLLSGGSGSVTYQVRVAP